MTKPQRPKNTPKEVITYKRRPAWVRKIIQDEAKYDSSDGSIRESKRPCTYSSYVALLSDIIGAEPIGPSRCTERLGGVNQYKTILTF